MPRLMETTPSPSAPFVAFLFLVMACGSEEGEGQGVRAGREAPAVAARVRSQDPRAVDLRSLLDFGELGRARALLADPPADLGLELELLRARAAALAGDSTAAARRIEAARALDGADARVFATAAELHAADGRLQTARSELERGNEVCGPTAELLRAQGIVLLCQNGGAAAGLRLLKQALALDPDLPFTARALGQAHLLLGRRALADQLPSAALDHALRAVFCDPEDLDSRRFLADVRGARGELEDALAILEELVAEGHPLQAELAMLSRRAALAAILRGGRERGLDLFVRARDLGLSAAELRSGASILAEAASVAEGEGLEAYERDELESAAERFRRALFLDPGRLAARNHLAVVLFRGEDFEGAARHWAEVLEAARAAGVALPEPVHLNLARALSRQGDRRGAREVLTAALERAPEGPWAEESRRALEALDP
jgi:tetratricopeptide (TPR) repeat protein